MFLKVIGLLVALSVSAIKGQNLINPPIPLVSDPGLVYSGDHGAPVKLEFFGEMLCSDTFRAWPIMKQLSADYPPTQLQIVVHQLALPYHRNAQLATQAFYLVNDLAVNRTWEFYEGVLNNYAFFGNSATRAKSMDQVIADLATYASDHAGIPEENFQLFFDRYNGQAVTAWKYAARRGMAGTPMYAINGIDLALNPGIRPGIDEFKWVIDGLLPLATKQEHRQLEKQDLTSVNKVSEPKEKIDIAQAAPVNHGPWKKLKAFSAIFKN